jgi:methyl acetate hydrolase
LSVRRSAYYSYVKLKVMKKLFDPLIIFGVLVLFYAFRSGDQKVNNDPYKDEAWNKIFDSVARNNPLPAFYVASIDKKGVNYHYVHGKEIWTKDKALDENSVFRIYSMTKALTSVSVMQLVEQGKIKLDEPLDKWLPDMIEIPVLKDDGTLVKSNKTITLRQLLTHTSGFAYFFTNSKLAKFKKPNDWKYKDLPRVFEPGANYNYGTSLDWVGKLIERISGKNLEQYIEQNICQPLQMNRTFFTVPDSLIKNIVSFGQLKGDKFVADTAWQMNRAEIKPKEFIGGGGLFSTAHDYGRFIQCILNDGTLNGKRIIKKSTLDTMCVNQMGDLRIQFDIPKMFSSLLDNTSRGIGRDEMGLGWAIEVSGTDRGPYGSVYWGGLANTYFNIDRKHGKAVMFFSNVLPFGNKYPESIFAKAQELFYK